MKRKKKKSKSIKTPCCKSNSFAVGSDRKLIYYFVINIPKCNILLNTTEFIANRAVICV